MTGIVVDGIESVASESAGAASMWDCDGYAKLFTEYPLIIGAGGAGLGIGGANVFCSCCGLCRGEVVGASGGFSAYTDLAGDNGGRPAFCFIGGGAAFDDGNAELPV